MAPTDVKQGDHVIYRAAGTEYDAVALSAPSFGHHTGLRSVGHFLNLRYLDERGAAVMIMGAGLLTSAADAATIAEYARANVEASGAAKFAADGGESLLAEERERLRAQPRTTGWRPRVDGEEVADLKATIKEYERSYHELTAALNAANETNAKLQQELATPAKAAPPVPRQTGQQGGRCVTDPATDLIPAEGAPAGDFTDPLVSGRPQPENVGAPSSADLDAVAAEAAATEATGAPGPDDEPAEPETVQQ